MPCSLVIRNMSSTPCNRANIPIEVKEGCSRAGSPKGFSPSTARRSSPPFAASANLVWCFLFADVTEPDDHGASQCQCHTYSFTCADLHIPVCAVRSQVKI